MAKVLTAAELGDVIKELLTGDRIGDAKQFAVFVNSLGEAITCAMGGDSSRSRFTKDDSLGWTLAFIDPFKDAPGLARLLKNYDPEGELYDGQFELECRQWGHVWQNTITDPVSPNCLHCGAEGKPITQELVDKLQEEMKESPHE